MKENFQKLVTNVKTWIGNYPVRFISLICVVVMVIGFALPFASLRGNVAVEGVSENPIELVSPRSKLVSINLMDFVLQKPIESIRVLDVPLSDLQVLDGTILDILRDNDGLDTEFFDELAKNLDESTLSILIDPELQNGIRENLEFGEDVNTILTSIHSILGNARQVVESISSALHEGGSILGEISEVVAQIDSAKMAVNIVVLIIFAALVADFVLLLRKKTSQKTLLVFSSVFMALFIVIGIGMFAGNAVIAEKVNEISMQVNTAIFDNVTIVLNNMLGDTGNLLGDFFRGQGDIVTLKLSLRADSGFWFIFIGAAISFILTLIQYFGFSVKEEQTLAAATGEAKSTAVVMTDDKISDGEEVLPPAESLTETTEELQTSVADDVAVEDEKKSETEAAGDEEKESKA